MNRALAVSVILAALLFPACSSDADSTSSASQDTAEPSGTVDGKVILTQSETNAATTSYVNGGTCNGVGGYSDIRTGMEVTLLRDGEIVALARLGRGEINHSARVTKPAGGTVTTYECWFDYSFVIPKKGEFFTVKPGRRGELTFTRAEILAPLALVFTIGDK